MRTYLELRLLGLELVQQGGHGLHRAPVFLAGQRDLLQLFRLRETQNSFRSDENRSESSSILSTNDWRGLHDVGAPK